MKNIAKKTTDQEIRQLVIERLKISPSGKKISIGSEGEFTKEELINHVDKNDNIGKKIVDIQLNYLQSLKTGIISDED